MKIISLSISLIVIFTARISICQISTGDTLQFWSVGYIDWQPNPAIEQRLLNAICKKVGEKCYFFVDAEVSSTPTSQQVESMVAIFDTSFVQKLTQLYGPVPDEFDNDSKVYFIIIPNEGWVGYFDPTHQMADSITQQIWNKHSNQKEIIYLSDDVFNYDENLVLAHEFGHMLHWGRDHSPDPPVNPIKYWEDAWIDEGFATFAPAFLLEGLTIQDIYDYEAYFALDPDLSLINFWGGPSYNQVKLWMVFMYEHFGEENFINTLINHQANGIEGVVNTLAMLGHTKSFNESFEQWIVANFLDSKTYENGKYGYFHYNFPNCKIAAAFNNYPTGNRIGSVSSYAADYILFSTNTARDISIYFDGVDSSKFRLVFIELGSNNSQIYSVKSCLLDSLNSATYYLDSLGTDLKRLLMIVMSTDPLLDEYDKAFYNYSAEAITGIEDEFVNVISYKLEQNYPNPFNPSTTIKYTIPSVTLSGVEGSRVTLKVYDVLGKELATLVNEEQSPGNYEFELKSTVGSLQLASGVYFYKLQAGDFIQTRKMVLIK